MTRDCQHRGGAVLRDDVARALDELGLRAQTVAVHSSLSSFGRVQGGARAVVDALLDVRGVVLMPAFSEIGRTRPPDDDHPPRNGVDYNRYDEILPTLDVTAFDPDTFGVDSDIDDEMGAIPRAFLRTPGTVRSAHPSVSWAAHGEGAETFVHCHAATDPNAPLKKAYDADGHVLLLGVTLAQCTAIHLAEERAGRRPFIRWTLYTDGIAHRVREYGCSDGFVNLQPHLDPLAMSVTIGHCRATAYPVRGLVDAASALVEEQPEITLCPQRCERCLDAFEGGPG